MSKAKSDVARVAGIPPRKVDLATTDIGRIQKESVQRKFEIAVDQVTGMSKWLTGSLFAANSAGMITILNTADKLVMPAVPGCLFAAGLIFALLSGTAIQEIYNRLSEPLGELIEYWAEIEAGAPINTERQNDLIDRVRTIQKWGWAAPVPGWISGLLFVGGGFAIALGFNAS